MSCYFKLEVQIIWTQKNILKTDYKNELWILNKNEKKYIYKFRHWYFKYYIMYLLTYIIRFVDLYLHILGINTYIKLIVNLILLKYILNTKVRISNNS